MTSTYLSFPTGRHEGDKMGSEMTYMVTTLTKAYLEYVSWQGAHIHAHLYSCYF